MQIIDCMIAIINILIAKGRVYANCVRSSMVYRSETMPLVTDIERAEMEMIRLCGVLMKDRKTSEELS